MAASIATAVIVAMAITNSTEAIIIGAAVAADGVAGVVMA